jgi:transposase, IS605 orfB family
MENLNTVKTFSTIKIDVNKKELTEYFNDTGILVNNLTNVCIYINRHWYFYNQNIYYNNNPEKKQENYKPYNYDKKLIDNLLSYIKEYDYKRLKKHIKNGKLEKNFIKSNFNNKELSYIFLEYYLKNTDNIDYKHKNLGSHTAQQTVKKAVETFKGYYKSFFDYLKNKDKYSGRPELPKYKKKVSFCSFSFTNIECKIKNSKIRFPKTRLKLNFNYNTNNQKHVKTTVKKYYDKIQLQLVFEKEFVEKKKEDLESRHIAGIDLGINNIVTIATNKGKSLLVKDKYLKQLNQFSSKELSDIYTKQTTVGKLEKPKSSKKVKTIFRKKNNRITNFSYILANFIVKYCLNNNIDALVIGLNRDWKQESNLFKINNQSFQQIPFSKIIDKIEYKCKLNNIEVIIREESYTSKSNCLNYDYIPTYKKENRKEYKFTGNRIKRGLFKTDSGILINADVNGAINILRKEFGNVKIETDNIKYLTNPEVVKELIKTGKDKKYKNRIGIKKAEKIKKVS